MLNSLTKREQSLLAVVVFAIGLSVMFYMYVFTPKAETIAEQTAHAEALTAANQKAARELKAGNLRQLKEDAARYSENLAVMRQLVPTVNEVPGLLEQVSNSARRVGLDIASVTPQPVNPGGEGYDAHRYRLVVKGGFNDMTEFLTNVGSLPRIVTPSILKMKMADNSGAAQLGPNQRRRMPAMEAPIATEFDIETYVARGGEPVTTSRRGGTTP
ncbi:MAG TPA: type 4a pilus biogenesis protein PilO [Gemmatimonadaceae bacterium]|nr:type 4a pilus biogenesis protein PilO [Gemmatimonadaceae bacterium]